MDSVSSFRLSAPSSSTASFDAMSNELVENVCRFLKLRDLQSLMLIDSARYGALRFRIADIGLEAIDTDLFENHQLEAFERMHGLADWLGAGNFFGPEDNEVRVWENLFNRAVDARFLPEQQSGLSRNLMINAWRRIDNFDLPSKILTDKLLDLFASAEKALMQLGEGFALDFDHVYSREVIGRHLAKLTDYAAMEARGELPPQLEGLMSRWSAICFVRIEVIFLSDSLPDRLKAFHRNLTELEQLHPLLPREIALPLIQDMIGVVTSFPESLHVTLSLSTKKIIQSLSESDSNKMRELYHEKIFGSPDNPVQNGGDAPCLLM